MGINDGGTSPLLWNSANFGFVEASYCFGDVAVTKIPRKTFFVHRTKEQSCHFLTALHGNDDDDAVKESPADTTRYE